MNPVINIQHLHLYHELTNPLFESLKHPTMSDPRNSDLLASKEYEVKKIVAWHRNKSKHGHLRVSHAIEGLRP